MSKFAFVEVQRRLRDDIPYAIYMNCRYMYDTLVSGTRIQSPHYLVCGNYLSTVHVNLLSMLEFKRHTINNH